MQRRCLPDSGRVIDMKRYMVRITEAALADMEQVYHPIAYVLCAPENAMEQHNRIADAILTLETMPERFRIMDQSRSEAKKAG